MPRRPAYDEYEDYDDGADDYDYDYDDNYYEEEEEVYAGPDKGARRQGPESGVGGGAGPGAGAVAEAGGGEDSSRAAPPGVEASEGVTGGTPGAGAGAGGAGPTSNGSVQGKGGGRDGAPWSCPVCTFDNAPSFLQCDMCGTVRPQEAAGKLQGPRPAGKQELPPAGPALRLPLAQSPALASAPHKPGPSKQSRPASTITLGAPAPVSAPAPASAPATSWSSAPAQPSGATSLKAKGGPAAHQQAAPGASLASDSGSLRDGAGKGLAAAAGALRLDEGSAGGAATQDRGPGGEQAGGAAERKPLGEYKPEKWVLEAGEMADAEKPTVHLVVIGHVDAGKSTLTGHLLHSLGLVSNKEMHKNRKEAAEKGKGSFAYAWVMDEGSEERERGVTMSLAVATMETPKLHLKLLDAPGHRDFVPSMIAGAAQADAAVLVIDSTPGALEAGVEGTGLKGGKGQTWEHLQLARSSGVDQLIVAVNKMDACGYSQGVFDSIKAKLMPLLKQSGYRDSAVTFVPLSGLQGENLDKGAQTPELKAWYTGPSLIEAIDRLAPPPRDLTHPLRVPISEVIPKGRALGAAAVSGKVETGGIKGGLKVVVMPGAHACSVKSMEVSGEARKVAVAGQSVDVGLVGVEPNALFPGAVLCSPEFPVLVARRFEARILTLEAPIPLLRGSQVVVHVHAAREAAIVSKLVSLLDPKTGQVTKRQPRALPSNSSAVVEVTAERPLCLESYSDIRSLGRIALRESGRTVAVGIVTRVLIES